MFDNEVMIVHGTWQNNLDQESDTGVVYRTRFDIAQGTWASETLGFAGQYGGGGQAIGNLDENAWIFGREFFRSALTSNLKDALYFVGDTQPIQFRTLEEYALTSNLFQNLQISTLPSELPFLSFTQRPGGACQNFGGFEVCPVDRLCFYRPTDEDSDGLPDVVEVELGTDPDSADTDGDGQSDGEEVLETGTAPLSCVEQLVPSPMGAEFSACIGTRLTQYACDASAGDGVSNPTEIGSVWPLWRLRDEQTQSCGFGEHYGLDAFLGTPTFVVLLADWCGFCRSQSEKLQQMKTELLMWATILTL